MRQKTRRMDAPYWIRLHSHNVLEKIRKKREAASSKSQAINETVPYNDIEEAQAPSSKRLETDTIKK